MNLILQQMMNYYHIFCKFINIKIDNLKFSIIYIYIMENTNNKIINEKTDDNYWQTQALLVMNNLNLSEKSNNIFPVKYTIKGKNTNANNRINNNLELMEDISI